MNKYTFFYSECFSQWHRSEFVVDDITYNCAEQYMMHQKALLFGDNETARKIMKEKHPRDQKALGRQVKNFNAKVWNEKAKEIVYTGNFAKFTQNSKLLKKLMETGDTILVEASPYDCIWGIGLSMKNELRHDPNNWQGTNWLGEVLTNLRNNIAAKSRNERN